MKSLYATAALMAAANAMQLEAGVTAQEQESFIQFLASSGQDVNDVDDFSLREHMFARSDRWINNAN